MTLMDRAVEALLKDITAQGGVYYMDIPAVEKAVRAVLSSVRNPDRKWAAEVCEDICEPELLFNPAPASAFTAMVDAILNEGRSAQ